MESSILEQISESIKRGRSRDTERLVQEAVEKGVNPEQILRQAMIPAMKEAGTDFKASDEDIPEILSSARSMKKGLAVLEPHLVKMGKSHIGTAILGTVEGDLHEVGKNLVAIMFRCEGIDVIDLGVDVSEKEFIRSIRENPQAQVVCISSLLTTTLQPMRGIVKAIRRLDTEHRLHIMVGGGSVNEKLAKDMGADAYTDNAVDAAARAREFLLSDR